MKKTAVHVETDVDEADVDDIVEIASELMIEEEDDLTLAEMKEVGEELDIPAEYIERAQVELRRRRELEKVAELEADAAAQVRKKVAIGSGVVVGLIALIAVAMSVSSVNTAYKNVEATAAQVANVQQRKAAVVKQWEGQPSSPDKQAELSGAENRIRVETKRYADAAAEYNAAASGPLGSVATGILGLPDGVPVTP